MKPRQPAPIKPPSLDEFKPIRRRHRDVGVLYTMVDTDRAALEVESRGLSSAWFNEPFSAERFILNPMYPWLAYRRFTRRHIADCLMKHEKTLCSERGLRYRREEALAKVAGRMQMPVDKVRNLINRSSRVVPKRRKKFVSKFW